MRWHRAVASLAVLTGGCSLLLTDDLTGGSSPIAAAVPDASDGAANTRPDGALGPDSGTLPPKVLFDAGGDGGTCDASFCDDFDELPLGARWSRTLVRRDAGLSLDPDAPSGASALAVSAPPSSYAGSNEAILELDLGIVSRVSCSFDLRVDEGGVAPKFDWLDVVGIDLDGVESSGAKRARLNFAVHGNKISFRDDVYYEDGGCGCPRSWPEGSPISFTTWRRVSVETDFTSASIRVDGVTLVATAFPAFPRGAARLRFGGQNFQVSGWRIRMDSLRCTVQ